MKPLIKIIERDSIVYRIDYTHKRVDAYVLNCREDLKNILIKISKEYGLKDNMLFKDSLLPGIKSYYQGTAKTSPEDAFDENFGMKLARNRACLKREKAYVKYLTNMLSKINQNAWTYLQAMLKRGMLLNIYEDKVLDLTGEKPRNKKAIKKIGKIIERIKNIPILIKK